MDENNNKNDRDVMMGLELNIQKIREIEVPLFELEQKVMRLEAQLQTKDFDIDFIANSVCKMINAKPMIMLPTITHQVN